MAIFIGDTPAQKIQQTGEFLNKIQQDYEAEKLRREEYTNQFDASQEDYSMLFDEFKPVLGEMVKGIVEAQVKVEETNSQEARDLLKQKSKEYQNLLAIAKAHTQVGAKALNDAANGLYVETREDIQNQITNRLGNAMKGINLDNLYESEIFNPDFLLFNAVPYDATLNATNPSVAGDPIFTAMGGRTSDFYDYNDEKGRYEFNENKFNKIFNDISNNVLVDGSRLMQSAAYVSAFMHPEYMVERSMAEARDYILNDEKLSNTAKAEYQELIRGYVKERFSTEKSSYQVGGTGTVKPFVPFKFYEKMIVDGVPIGGDAEKDVYSVGSKHAVVVANGSKYFFKLKEEAQIEDIEEFLKNAQEAGGEQTFNDLFERVSTQDNFLSSLRSDALIKKYRATFGMEKQEETSKTSTFPSYDVWLKENPGKSFSDWKEQWEKNNK